MKSRRTLIGTATFLAVFLVGLGAYYYRSNHRFILPPAMVYQNLPTEFNQRLAAQRQAVESGKNRSEELRGLARLYEANGLDSEALSCFKSLSKESSGLSAQDHYSLADLAQNSGDLTTAEAELFQVVQREPKYLPARIRLGEILFKIGQSAKAEEQYNAALSLEPNQPQANFGLARVELQRGLDQAAAQRLDSLLAHHPDATGSAALLAQILSRQGHPERAKALTQASRQSPEPSLSDPWLDAIFADCFDIQRLALKFEDYSKDGQMDRALPLLTRFEQLDPASWIPQLLRGWSQDQARQTDQAEASYRQALGKAGPAEKIVPLLVSDLIKEGKLTEAADLAKQYYIKTPDSITLLTLYTDVTLRQNNQALSLTLLNELLKRDPYLYWANLNLAKLLWPAGRHDQAVECLLRIVAVFPGDVISRGWLGQYYLEKDDPSSAIPFLEQAIQASAPDSPEKGKLAGMLYIAYIQAGNAQASREQTESAMKYFDQAILLDASELAGYLGKASLAVRLKQYPAAAEQLKKMQKLQPDNPTIFLSLGDVLYQEGHPDDAKVQWQKAVPLTDPANLALKNALVERLSGKITAETFR